MEEFVEGAYLLELKIQCMFALQAVQAFGNSYMAWENTRPKEPSDVVPDELYVWRREVFRNLHSFLTHTANVAKLFWPMRERDRAKDEIAKIRADHLKNLLEINDDNPLADRKIRNHLDHYDTRLDEWAVGIEESSVKSIFVDSIGPFNIKLISGPFVNNEDIERGKMRWFDPETVRLHFRGESVDIQEVISAIEELMEKLDSIKPS